MMVEVPGAQINAEVNGRGVTLVFLHAGVADLRMWNAQVATLFEAGYRTIAFDRRGFGETLYEPDEPFSNVADLKFVLDELSVDKAVLVGCSQGGRVALDFALAHPSRVSGLALMATAVSGAPEVDEDPKYQALAEEYARVEQGGDLERLNQIEARVWLDGPAAAEGRVSGDTRTLFLDMNGKSLAHAPRTAERQPAPAWGRMAEVSQQCLLLSGALDWPEFAARNEAMAELMPEAETQTLDNTAHMAPMDAPDSFNKALKAFLVDVGV